MTRLSGNRWDFGDPTGQIWLMRPDASELRQISYQLKETEEYEFGTVVSIAIED